MQTYCGFCDEAMPLDDPTEHMCEDRAYYLEEYANLAMVSSFHYRPTSIIAAEQFLAAHPEFKEHQPRSTMQRFNSRENLDYELPSDYDADELPVTYEPDFNSWSREDEWDGIYDQRDNYQRALVPAYWRDVETTRCTFAVTWWHRYVDNFDYRMSGVYQDFPHVPKGFTLNETYSPAYDSLDYSDRNLSELSFTELQGFAAQQLIDLNITKRYQFKLFNIFYGNDNHLHCGLLTITNDHVKCFRPGCYFFNHPLPIPVDPDRATMEAFTHAIIRHGNNHGPEWYTNRNDFAFIHAENCDTHHNRSEGCNANVHVETLDLMSLEGALNFLIRHRKFCRDSNCRCTAYYHVVSQLTYERSAA